MLANVRKIWQRFLYHDSVLLEAERQKSLSGRVDDWAVEFSKLEDDDVFATFIQVPPVTTSSYCILVLNLPELHICALVNRDHTEFLA